MAKKTKSFNGSVVTSLEEILKFGYHPERIIRTDYDKDQTLFVTHQTIYDDYNGRKILSKIIRFEYLLLPTENGYYIVKYNEDNDEVSKHSVDGSSNAQEQAELIAEQVFGLEPPHFSTFLNNPRKRKNPMNKSFSKTLAKKIESIIDSHGIYGYLVVKVKNNQIQIKVIEGGDSVDYIFLPMSSEQGYIVIRYIPNFRLEKWEETDRWHVISDGSAEDMAFEIAEKVFGLSGYNIPDLDWELNPRRKNPMATGTLLALGLGIILGKSK